MPQGISKIKLIVANRFNDGGWNEMIYRQPGPNTGSNLRRRNSQGKTGQSAAAKRGGKWNFRLPRPWDHNEFGQSRQFAGVPPLRQLRHVIRADQIKQSRFGKPPRVCLNGVNRVGHPSAPDFLVVHFAPVPACKREPQQAQSHCRCGGPAIRLERRLRRRNKEQPRQIQFLPGRLRNEQVPEVNRIKRPAKKSELHSRQQHRVTPLKRRSVHSR